MRYLRDVGEHQPHPGPSVPEWWKPAMQREQSEREDALKRKQEEGK